MFNIKKFSTPPVIHFPGYFWFLNGKLEEDELRKQIRDMAAAGAKTICPHPFPPEMRDYFMSTMSPGYLTEDYFKLYKVIADECKKLKLNCWLYDEGGWPSGMACGQVWKSDPEYFTRQMITLDETGKGWKIIKETQVPKRAERPDILKKGAVEKFLELTHKNYAKHIGEHFGKTFRFVFMDEPEMARSGGYILPWTDDFAEKFMEYKGYDIRPHLVSILRHDPLPENMKYRIDFHDVRSRLFSERFMIPIRDWCRKNGLLSGGHMNGDEDMPDASKRVFGGHLLRTLRCLDFPGVDLIWRQLWMGKHDRCYEPFPKFASSVANQGGHRFVSAEVFGVYGSGLTMEQMLQIVDFCAACGVNTFIACVKPYSTADGLYEGERPHFGPVNPQWKHIKSAHEYTARMSYLASSGRPEVGTAFFIDMLTAWSGAQNAAFGNRLRHKIETKLIERQIDFDYVDDDVLSVAEFKNGKLIIGKAAYDRLLIPGGARMTPETEKRLAQLRKKGLEVVWSDQLDKNVPPTLESSSGLLQVCKRRLDKDNVMYFVFNTSSFPVESKLTAVEKSAVARFDCYNGKLYRAGEKGKWKHTFAPFRTEVFLVGSRAEQGETAPDVPGKVMLKLENFQLKGVEKHFFKERDFAVEKLSAPAVDAKCGSWFPYLGKDFSGSAVYTAEFTGKPGMRFLDLGMVKYSARVRLNGKDLGVAVNSPYIFDLAPALKENGKNLLEVEVVNTLANAILADGVFEKWQKLPLECPYERKQRQFEVESLDSGLYGPVCIKSSEK